MSTNPDPDPSSPESIRREMAQSLAAIVYSASPSLELDFANRCALEYFGFATEAIAGDRWLDLVHPDDRASVLAAWEGSRVTGQHYRHEHRLRLADGHYRRFLAEALPLRDEHGAIVKWFGVLTPLGEPRQRGPRTRPAKVDYYPLRDAAGNLQLLEIAAWDERPDDPAAKRHALGFWYRVEPI